MDCKLGINIYDRGILYFRGSEVYWSNKLPNFHSVYSDMKINVLYSNVHSPGDITMIIVMLWRTGDWDLCYRMDPINIIESDTDQLQEKGVPDIHPDVNSGQARIVRYLQ